MYQASRLTNIFQEFSVPLIIGVLAGLATANIDPSFYGKVVEFHLFGEDAKILGHPVTVHFLINEMFMVFFFGIAAKEITDSVLPGGALNPPNKAINPLMGTIGGILGPVGVYFLLTTLFYGGTENFSEVANGWGIPTATDIALAWLVARIVFGSHHSAVNFLLLLAVADDAIGLGIIAVFYPDPSHPVEPVWLLLTLGGMAAAYGLRRMQVGLWPLYVLIGGGLSWSGLALSGVEPALALVVIVPFLPGPRLDPVLVRSHHEPIAEVQPEAAAGHHGGHAISPLDQFEHQLKLTVDLGLFFFAFANAGVAFGSINSVTLIILLSLVVGKTIGISLFSWAGTRLGFPLPPDMGFRHLAVTGLIAGLGLTVALFVAGKAFPAGSAFQDPAKMGAVLSAGVAFLAIGIGRALKLRDPAGEK